MGVREQVRELTPQLWLVLWIVLLNSFKYFTLSTVLTLFATDEYGMSDIRAGSLYGMWGLLHTVWGFVGSLAVDRYGIRAVALTATSLGVLSRGLIVFTRSEHIFRAVLLGIGPLAEGVCDPLYMVAIKKLTRRRVRGFAFGLQYAFMNFGGAIGENFIDLVRERVWVTPWGEQWTGLRFALFMTWVAAVACWLLAWFVRNPRDRASKVPEHWSPGLEGNAFHQEASAGYVALLHPSPESSPASSPTGSPAHIAFDPELPCDVVLHTEVLPPSALDAKADDRGPEPAREAGGRGSGALQFVQSYVADGAFQRAVLMTTAVMFVSLQWKYMDTLLPKFADRVFGPACPWATIYSINSWMCVFCPPLISALAPGDRFDDFHLIVPGLWIMALSPACIWLSVSEAATASWVFLLSCGEVLWSPRSQSFVASLAPHGREGAFLALAGLPQFLSQYPVGMVSGWLLDTYCPACPGNRNRSCTSDSDWRADPATMWLLVAATSAASPVLVTASMGYLRRGNAGRAHDDEDY